jgi:hypothetical protein
MKMVKMIVFKDVQVFMLLVLASFLGVSLFFLVKPSPTVYEVRTCQDVRNIAKDLDGTYILMNDIDFSKCEDYE